MSTPSFENSESFRQDNLGRDPEDEGMGFLTNKFPVIGILMWLIAAAAVSGLIIWLSW